MKWRTEVWGREKAGVRDGGPGSQFIKTRYGSVGKRISAARASSFVDPYGAARDESTSVRDRDLVHGLEVRIVLGQCRVQIRKNDEVIRSLILQEPQNTGIG